MDRFINREKLQYAITQLWTKLKTTFAQLGAENVFTKKNTFDDVVMIKRETMYVNSPINNDPVVLTGSNKIVGCREYTSHSNGNNGYVKSVKLKVNDTYSVGSTLRYIRLWSVEKGDSLEQDVILEEIHSPETYFTVKEEVGFGKYIEMFVDRKFENPTYFLVGHGNSISYTKTVAESDDNIYGTLNSVPQVGHTGITSTHRQYLVQYGLIGESMNLAVELEKLSNISSGSVFSVNNVKPDGQGNVSIEMSNIPGLLGDNSKLATNIMPDIAITSVTVVDSEEEAMGLTVQVGDVVIRTDQQGESYICNNEQGDSFANKFVRLGSASDTIKTINRQPSTAGNIDLGLTSNETQIDLTANGQVIASLSIITEQEVNDIINALV